MANGAVPGPAASAVIRRIPNRFPGVPPHGDGPGARATRHPDLRSDLRPWRGRSRSWFMHPGGSTMSATIFGPRRGRFATSPTVTTRTRQPHRPRGRSAHRRPHPRVPREARAAGRRRLDGPVGLSPGVDRRDRRQRVRARRHDHAPGDPHRRQPGRRPRRTTRGRSPPTPAATSPSTLVRRPRQLGRRLAQDFTATDTTSPATWRRRTSRTRSPQLQAPTTHAEGSAVSLHAHGEWIRIQLHVAGDVEGRHDGPPLN